MKRFFAITLAAILVVAISAPSMATESRLQAMGGVHKYVEDDANIFDWPATLPSYANLFTIDVMPYYYDNGHGREMNMYGLTKSIGEYGDLGTVGIFFTEFVGGPNNYFSDLELPMENWNAFSGSTYSKWMLLYGFEISEELSVGIKFMRSSESRTYEWDWKENMTPQDTSATIEDKLAYTTIGASFRMEVSDDMHFDLGFDYTMASRTDNMQMDVDEEFPEDIDWDDSDPCGEITEDPGYDMNLRGRVFYNWTDMITLVPYVGFRMSEFNYTTANDSCNSLKFGMYGLKGMEFNFGIATNMMVNEDNMIVMAIELFNYTKVEPSEYVYSEDLMPEGYSYDEEFSAHKRVMPGFILGLESDVKDWLTFRTGCTKMLNAYGGEHTVKASMEGNAAESTDELSWDDAPFEWYLGLGFHVGDFTIDCLVDKSVPFSMGYWLTGNEYGSEGAPIYRISALYAF